MTLWTRETGTHTGFTNGISHRTLDDLLGVEMMPVRVLPDGSVDDAPADAPRYPEPMMALDEDGQLYPDADADLLRQVAPWGLMSGYTGQLGYSGPVMHPSEYIGGRMADDILSNPGLYVAVAVECTDGDAAGWVLATIADEA